MYKTAYPIYKPLYFAYKKSSDRDRINEIRNYVKEGMTVLDIGANIGFYTLLLSRLVGKSGKVYAFEPDATNFRHLSNNVRNCSNVVLHQAAVGEKSGNIKLFHSSDLNVDHQTFDSGEGRPYTEIPCVALDDVIPTPQKVDFIKIDIQGYEYYAFKGMSQLLQRSQPLLLMGEVWPYALQKAGTSVAQYLQLLQQAGLNSNILGNYDAAALQAKADDKSFYTDLIARK
ncbi:MAG: FkbM family methyltransferase [Sphingobacteriales bacterium]|nr:FkbM family methyltransferase [Sphingobacteriales bacterium]